MVFFHGLFFSRVFCFSCLSVFSWVGGLAGVARDRMVEH
jgi:hypothetical protein